jgi:hypothetical protein
MNSGAGVPARLPRRRREANQVPTVKLSDSVIANGKSEEAKRELDLLVLEVLREALVKRPGVRCA